MTKKIRSAWSKDELKKIVANLPAGWAATLAEAHSLTPGTVENVMYGLQGNDAVVGSAVELATKNKNYIAAKKELVNAL